MATWQSRVAWSLCAASVLAAGAQVAQLAWADGPLLSAESFSEGFPLITAGAVASAAVGALIVSRYPRHPIGWLFSIGALGTAVDMAVGTYGSRAVRAGDLATTWAAGPAIRVATILGALYTLALIAILFLLVPDGRLPSRRWWPALALPVVGLATYIAGVVAIPPERLARASEASDSSFSGVTVFLVSAGNVLVALALPVAAAALLVRLRSAHGEQRQQLRWIATSAAALVAAAAFTVVVQALSWGDKVPSVTFLPLFLAYLAVPLCAGVAILRYRLYDIDVIINRALVLAVLAAFVTAGYVAVVILVGAGVGGLSEGPFWPSLLAIAVVALAFQPLRNRVLHWADRLVYGKRAVPYEALADFSRRIGAAASPSDLLPLFAEAAGRSVGARGARVHLDVPGTAGLWAAWPEGTDSVDDQSSVQLTVTDRGEPMGLLALTMPPGRALRAEERRLLEGFAEQAGLALRNVRLEAELRARVAEAARQSSALEASRRRLLEARDAERQRVAATINRTVVAQLEPLVPALESGWQAGPEEVSDLLRRLDAATGATLDALRDVTHGLFPAVLSRRGLVPALRAHLATTGLTGVLQVPAPLQERRFSPAAEAAAYFCCLAALDDLARPTDLRLALRDGLLILDVAGTASDGGHPPQPAQHSFVVDRVEAAGGRVRLDRAPDGTLVLHAELPAEVPLPA
jgi:signal transduction histidine kinase